MHTFLANSVALHNKILPNAHMHVSKTESSSGGFLWMINNLSFVIKKGTPCYTDQLVYLLMTLQEQPKKAFSVQEPSHETVKVRGKTEIQHPLRFLQ